jgi:hypothetical protein
MGSDQLILNEFKVLYKFLRRGLPAWASFLLLGFLVWVEKKTINQRIVNEVDKAVEEYEQIDPPQVVLPAPIYSESGTDFFDEMRLSAPWVDREPPSASS